MSTSPDTGEPSAWPSQAVRSGYTGTVNVNEGYAATWASVDAPMGGFKQSGLGRRHVHDPYQGQGVGRRLLELLVEAAREREITRLRSLIQSDNDPMMWLLRRVLPDARLEDRSDQECTYSADITVAPPRAGASALFGDHRRERVASCGIQGGRRHVQPAKRAG